MAHRVLSLKRMHVNLEPGRHIDLRPKDLDRTQPRPAPLERSKSSPHLGMPPPEAKVTGRETHRTPVQKEEVRLSQPSSVMGLQVKETARKNASKPARKNASKPARKNASKASGRSGRVESKKARAPARTRTLGELVQAMHTDKPRTKTQLLEVLSRADLKPQDPDPKSASRLFEIAAYCCRGEENAEGLRDAFQMCSMLYRSKGCKAFGKLSPQRMAVDLMIRSLSPEKIDQKGYGLCGPAAFMMQLAKDDPKAYVRAATDLAMAGRTRIGKLDLRPCDAVKGYDPNGKIADADWLMLGSLTNGDDIQTREKNDTLGEYGGSHMGHMFGWLKQAGFSSVMSVPVYTSDSILSHKAGNDAAKGHGKVVSTLIKLVSPLAVPTQYSNGKPSFVDDKTAWKGPDNIALAGDLARRGFKVFVTINESIANPRTVRGLEEQVPIFKELALQSKDESQIKKWSRSPDEIRGDLVTEKIDQDPKTNHWALLDDVKIREDGKVSVTVYSYGEKSTLPPVDMATFQKIYGGFVAATEMTTKEAESCWTSADRAEAMGYQPL